MLSSVLSGCIVLACWMGLSWFYADNVKRKRPEIDIDPQLYLVGGFLFGPFAILYCWNKKRVFEKYNLNYRNKRNQ